ncbi:MAG: nicotinamide mononucleotide transporter [Flavobacteriaceae bacterium]|nr:nicotinamide mononucleotide transporter [Flavobacteriaceae bacterium]|tara:strand:+ start:797 stop:1414 length:618 start_codon:yes stop_codon:yes gene_type:complete
MEQLTDFFLEPYYNKLVIDTTLEAIALVFGIISVIYAKKANILVYPTGIICTVITVFLLFKAKYFGDMMMNIYYSIMSIYGWWNWSRKDNDNYLVKISRIKLEDLNSVIIFFLVTVLITFLVYKTSSVDMVIFNYVDIFTSGLFFVAMWLMANKKLESWIFWIIADIITVPLYAFRGLGMLSLQYIIFTVLAIQGYLEWKKHLSK